MERYHFSDAEQTHMERARIPFAIYQFLEKRVVTIALSAGFRELFGYNDDNAQAYHDMDYDMYKDTHPDDAARIADAAFRFATQGGRYDVIYRTKTLGRSGYRIIHAQGEHIFTETGERLAQVWYTDEGFYSGEETDTWNALNSTLKSALYEESFIRASYYDHLTGLPTMTYFFELAVCIQKELLESERHPAMLFLDFGGMKYFNYKFGFSQGDELLHGFARLLAAAFNNESCCRIGQDHFAVVADSEGLEEKLHALFLQTSRLNKGQALPVHVGIYPDWIGGIDASRACDMAKFACKALKNEHASVFNYYDLSMKASEEKQRYIISNLDRAIEENWIVVYYQPIVRAVNGRVCDEEALARWIDPVKGIMSPADFIPILEEHRLIYKLDLFVVDCVIRKIRIMQEAGLHLMPQSINLSRSDFDTCNIVEEICRRADDAGISHSLLTIEITESIIGKDLDFMKGQIERFRSLGFQVWMDDFGSGYSSLDVLQELTFDLIKFDMRFMRQFSENSRSRIILTELLRMATSLGIDTICEGVETAEQARFLQETGCTKLQGYYFTKPIPVEKILERYEKGKQIGFENPDELAYYEAIGRVNLHDLSVIAQETTGAFDNIFNSIPMAVIESSHGQVRYARSNQPYRDFMCRYFNMCISDKPEPFYNTPGARKSPFMKTLLRCIEDSSPFFIDDNLPNGITVHSALRRIAVNPVTDTAAVAIAVLSISKDDYSSTYANIAKALAADYFALFYVDLNTEIYYEYSSQCEGSDIAMVRKGERFFEASWEDAAQYAHPDDREMFIREFTRENILQKLEERGSFSLTYRMLGSAPMYVNMKVIRTKTDPDHLTIGMSNVDAQIKQQQSLEQVRRNQAVFKKLIALSGNYYVIYTVDPETGSYVEYSADDNYSGFALPKRGDNIFLSAQQDFEMVVHPDDIQMMRDLFTREEVLETIQRNGSFTMQCRLKYHGRIVPVVLRASIFEEDGKTELLIAVCKP